jgi:hypothetical protein
MTAEGTIGAPTCFVINEPVITVVPNYETSFCLIKTGTLHSKINYDLIDLVFFFFNNRVKYELLVSQRPRQYLNVNS